MVMALRQSEAYGRTVRTGLIADIAGLYYNLLALDQQFLITGQSIDIRREDVESMKALKESNVVTGAAVVQSEANRYSAEVTLPEIRRSIRETENSLSIILGRSPGAINRSTLDSQRIDLELKTGVPALLLSNRPDVQQAEYQLRYNAELTNVARAYFYPSLSITAQAGYTGSDFSNLINSSTFFTNIIGGLTQPIFNQGINRQRLRVAKARQAESLAAFKQSLLNAGREVSNALFAYQTATEKIDIRAKQVSFLEKSVEYTKELLKYTSATNYTDVLTSEQGLLNAQLSSINDKQQQLLSLIDLYRSLGGGVR
jgi:outer membrane protein, multidrug efflux system